MRHEHDNGSDTDTDATGRRPAASGWRFGPGPARWPSLLIVLTLVGAILAGMISDGRAGSSFLQGTPEGAGTPSASPEASPEASPGAAAFGPLVIDGDPITRLVVTRPGAAAILVAGGDGLYRSDNGARRWRKVGPAPPEGRIVVAEENPQVLLAGDRGVCARGDAGTPLSRSDDAGATWQPVDGVSGVLPLAIWRRAKVAVGASCAGLQISTDTGRTWQQATLPDGTDEVTAFTPLPAPNTDNAEALIVRTSEGGTSRLRLLDLTDAARPQISNVLREFWGLGAPAGRQEIYAFGSAQGVWVSIDRGATWTLRRTGLEEVTVSVDPLGTPIPDAEQARGFGINALVMNPGQAARLYVGTNNGVYTSENAGARWERIENIDGNVTGIVVARRTARLLAETPSGVVLVPLGTRR